MNRTIATACLLALVAGGIPAQPSPAQPSPAPPQTMQPSSPQPPANPAPKKKGSAAKKKVSSQPEAQAQPITPAPPAAPSLPPTLMNRPPVNPTVTLRDGLLTIVAPNSILSDVLNGVRQATGAVIEGVTPNDRVAVRLGPGAPRQVIAALLKGTPYDYLILGSQQNPDGVTRILITQGSQGSQGSPSSEPNAPSPAPEENQPAAMEPPAEFFPQDQGVVSDSGSEGEQPPEPQRPPMTPPPGPPGEPTQPKTPEQLLREIQPQLSNRP